MSESIENFIHCQNGKFQLLMFFACSSWSYFSAMQLMVVAFIVPQSFDFECQIDAINDFNWTKEQRKNVSLPRLMDSYSQCIYYGRNYTLYEDMPFEEFLLITSENTTKPLKKCIKWTYADNISQTSVVAEWDLVCDDRYLGSLVQIVTMAGILVAAIFGGILADRFGRVRVISSGFVLAISSGISCAFSPTFHFFLLMRFVVGLSGSFVCITSYVLMLEWYLPRQRSIFGLLFSVPFALGYMTLPLFAYYCTDWRHLMSVISWSNTPLIINFLLITDSPRWLIQNRKFKQAVKAINFARKIDGKEKLKPQYLLDKFEIFSKRNSKSSISLECTTNSMKSGKCSSSLLIETPPTSLSDCVKEINFCGKSSMKLLKYTTVLSINWFICNFVYYGISLNGDNLGINLYLYMFLGGLMEIPAYTIVLPFVVKYGRKIPLIVFYVICSSCVFLPLLVGSRDIGSIAFVVSSMVAKLSITTAFQLVYLVSSEIFPTSFRTFGVGMTMMVGRIGSIVSPLVTNILGPINWKLTNVIFGACCLASAVVSLLLPETFRSYLPDTVNDMEIWTEDSTKKTRESTQTSEEDDQH